MLHNLKQYKMSKVLVKDLTDILKIMKDYEVALSTYKKYKPISKLLSNLIENRRIVKYHLEKHEAVISTKAQEGENV